ncbi:MAG TPA: PilZ domain-containing protein [Nitrospirota bacterium]
MTEKTDSAGNAPEAFPEKRREERYDVPAGCRQYIKLWVKSGDGFVPATLGNFSRNGILFESPVSFSREERSACIIAISLLLSREISFGISVRYCYAVKDSYITGAAIDTISDENWFDAFVEIHDLIAAQGSG